MYFNLICATSHIAKIGSVPGFFGLARPCLECPISPQNINVPHPQSCFTDALSQNRRHLKRKLTWIVVGNGPDTLGESRQRPPPLLPFPTVRLLFEVVAEEDPQNGSLRWGGGPTGYSDSMRKVWRSRAEEQLTALWEQPKMFLVQKEALKGQFRAIFLPERGLGDQNKKRTLRWACEEMWNHGSPDCQATTNRGRFGLVVKKKPVKSEKKETLWCH